MRDIVRNPDYVGDGLKLLPEQFKNKPRIAAWQGSYLARVQELEDAAVDYYIARQLQNDNTTGYLLDLFGKRVGQPRNGFGDGEYRILIRARIRTNKSNGKRETLLDICRLLFPSSDPIIFRAYLKAIEIEVNAVEIDPYYAWRDFLNRAKASGDSLRFIYSVEPTEKTLRRGSVYGGVTTVSSQRKNSVYGGGGTGVFAGVFGSASS